MIYINIHTHHPASTGACIQNVHGHFDKLPAQGFFSAGLHPWYLKEESGPEEYHQLATAVKNGQVLAIGECGLDKMCDTPWDLQLKYFQWQVQLANEVRKPIVIHCVRAYDEVIQVIKRADVPVIFHGFNRNSPLAEKLVARGYFLSFGPSLLKGQGEEALVHCPLDMIFLETDDKDASIEEVYQSASRILKLNNDSLKKQISMNAQRVFGPNFVPYE